MIKLFSRRNYTSLFFYSLLNTVSYRKYLSQHIIKIIESKPQNFSQCSNKLQKIVQKYTSQVQKLNNQQSSQNPQVQKIKTKLNMIFRVYSLPKILQKYKQQLSDMIVTQKLKNQSQLDRICGILQKKIKTNKNISICDIELAGKQQQNQKIILQQVLTQIKNSQQKINVSELTKKLRERFVNLDSKYIYEKVKKIESQFQSKIQNLQSQDSNKQKNAKQFWDKIQNIKPRLLVQQCNDPQIYKQHLAETKNRLRFRFPPQPNGYLHIGHIKSIRINFQTAKRSGGICYLRYDDTNPQTQSHEYIDNILYNVRWLGYEPDLITYASDYFQHMINFAVKLIKEGHAYVCDSPQIDIERERKQKIPNKYRDRPIQQSLKMFPNLQQGQTLRLKLDPSAKNPTLRDPVIYRIKDHPHPRTGNKYRIYPIYDFAHCICDSLEHIDYSLCSLQFQVRRQLYYKILDLLKLYKPSVWQYSRLNVEGSVISKRKIKALIEGHSIDSWTDPRLLTIGGLKNRGYTPSMLINFIDKVNASRTGNENIVQFSLLQRQMRKQLFKTAQKSMMVLEPQALQILNYEQIDKKKINAQLYTDPQRKQTRQISVGQILYVQKNQSIFSPGKLIVLKYLGVFQVLEPLSDNGRPVKIKKLNTDIKQLKQKKLQFKVLHWISKIQGIRMPVTVFDRLLTSEQKINPKSRQAFYNALVPKQIANAHKQLNKYWQMQRLGYFKFDKQGNFIRCTTLQ